MITLCLSFNAKVSRTFYVQDDWPEVLRDRWREQHLESQEQGALQFVIEIPRAELVLSLQIWIHEWKSDV